jgi:hypothetical protein
MYEHILSRFRCPLTIVTDQSTHFINDAIRYLIYHFIFRHTNFNIYYPQGNGQAKSINKVFGTLLTKLINEIKMMGMNTYRQSHIELPTKLELVIPHFSLCMDYIHYYL